MSSEHTGPPVGRVVGTEDATPLQFCVALARRLPAARRRRGHRPRRPRTRAGDAPPGSSPRSAPGTRARRFGSDVFLIADGVLPAQVQEIAEMTTTRVEPEVYVPPRPGDVGLPGHRRASGTRRCTSTRWSQGADRPGPRRRADLPQPRVPRRHPRRARLDQRDLRRRHQDELRPVPAVLDVHRRRARRRARQHEGAGLQRQGRGPAVPRPRRTRELDDDLRAAYATLGLAGGAVRLGRLLRPADARTTRPAGRTSPAAPAGSPRSGGRSRSSAPASCCRTCSPTPRTSATSTRWWSTRSPPGCGARPSPTGTDGAVSIDGRPLRTYDELVELVVDQVTDDDAAPRLGGPGHRHGHRQRVHPPAAVVAQAAAVASCAPTCP